MTRSRSRSGKTHFMPNESTELDGPRRTSARVHHPHRLAARVGGLDGGFKWQVNLFDVWQSIEFGSERDGRTGLGPMQHGHDARPADRGMDLEAERARSCSDVGAGLIFAVREFGVLTESMPRDARSSRRACSGFRSLTAWKGAVDCGRASVPFVSCAACPCVAATAPSVQCIIARMNEFTACILHGRRPSIGPGATSADLFQWIDKSAQRAPCKTVMQQPLPTSGTG